MKRIRLPSYDEPEAMSSDEDEGKFNFQIEAGDKKEMLAVEPPLVQFSHTIMDCR